MPRPIDNPNKDVRNQDARFDKRPNLTKIATPDLNGYGTAAKTSSAQVQDTGQAFGYDQSQAGGITFGQSSSYKTSTGLVNALDVTQGVTKIVDQTNRALDTLDKNKTIRMQGELAALEASEGFENLSPTEQFARVRKIQQGYKSGWVTQTGRTNWRKATSKLNFEEKSYDLEAGLAEIQLTERTRLNAGIDPTDIWEELDPMYAALRTRHGGQSSIIDNRIDMAMNTTRATTDALRFKTIKNLVDGIHADNGFEELTFGLDSDMPYEAWRDAALDLVHAKGGSEFQKMMGGEWDEDTNQFDGPWSGRTELEIDAIMQPLYNERLAQRVASEHRANMSNAAIEVANGGSIGVVDQLVNEDNYDAGAGMAHVIGSFGNALTLALAGGLSPGARTEYLNQNLTGLVKLQLENSTDPEGDSPTLLAAWMEIAEDDTFLTNLYSFMGAETDEEKEEVARRARLAIENGFEAFKADRRKAAEGAGQTNDAPIYQVGGAFTSGENLKKALNNSAWARAQTEPVLLLTAPQEGHEIPFVMSWMNFAVEAAFNRAMNDPNYSVEDAVNFKKEVADWFTEPGGGGGLIDPKELKARAEHLALRLKADFFTESDKPGAYNNPFSFTKSTTNNDWSLQSDGSVDSIDVTLIAASSYMKTRQDPHTNEYFLDTDWAGPESEVYFKRFSAKYKRLMSDSEDGKTSAITRMMLTDLGKVQDMFGQNTGTSIFAGPILEGILSSKRITVSDDTRPRVKSQLLAVIKNVDLTLEQKTEQIDGVLQSLMVRSRGRAWIDTKERTKTNLVFTDQGQIIKEADVSWETDILGTVAQGVGPDGKVRTHSTYVDPLEYLWELGISHTGLGLPGPQRASESIGKLLMQDAGAMLKFTDAMVAYAQTTNNESFVRYDPDTGQVSLDLNAFQKKPIVSSQALTKVLDNAGLELAVTFDKEGKMVAATFVNRPPLMTRNDRGELEETGGYLPAITGDISDAFKRGGVEVEDKYYDGLAQSLGRRLTGTETSASVYEMQGRLNDPHIRRYIRDIGTPASGVITNPKVRRSVADRVDAQLAVMVQAQPEGWAESPGGQALADLSAELRHTSGGSDLVRDYYFRARDLAKSQGIDLVGDKGDVGMYFFMAAVAMDAFDMSTWPHSPLGLIPRRTDGFETEGSRRGLIPTLWTVDDLFMVNGQPVPGEIQIPLFSPTTEVLDDQFDPRFFYKEQPPVNLLRPYN